MQGDIYVYMRIISAQLPKQWLLYYDEWFI